MQRETAGNTETEISAIKTQIYGGEKRAAARERFFSCVRSFCDSHTLIMKYDNTVSKAARQRRKKKQKKNTNFTHAGRGGPAGGGLKTLSRPYEGGSKSCDRHRISGTSYGPNLLDFSQWLDMTLSLTHVMKAIACLNAPTQEIDPKTSLKVVTSIDMQFYLSCYMNAQKFSVTFLLCLLVWKFSLITFGSMHKHLEQRAIIKFHAAQKKMAIQTWRELRQVHGAECMSQASVRRWMRRFKSDPGAPVVDKNCSG